MWCTVDIYEYLPLLLDKVHRGWRKKRKKKRNSEVCLWRLVSKLSVKALWDACKGHNENGVCLVFLLSGWMSPDRKIVFRQEQLYPSISSQRTGSIKTETEGSEIEENGKNGNFIFDETNNCPYFNRDAMYYTWLKYYDSKHPRNVNKILSFLLNEINLTTYKVISYFKFCKN